MLKKPLSSSKILLQNKSVGQFLVFLTAILTFFAGLSLIFLLNTHRYNQNWQQALKQNFLVEVKQSKKTDESLKNLNEVIAFLQQKAGIISVRVIPEQEALKLLEPWLGKSNLLENYRLPTLIDVTTQLNEEEIKNLDLDLKKQLPFTQISVHNTWSQPLSKFSWTLEILSVVVFALIIFAMILVIVNASRMGLSLQNNHVSILRLLGAPNRFISRQFEKFFVTKVILGSFLSTIILIALLHSFLSFFQNQFNLTHFLVNYSDAFFILLIPMTLMGIAYIVSRFTMMHLLKAPI